MNAPVKTPEERQAELQGMGDSRLRKVDARFIQGKGCLLYTSDAADD